MNGTTELLDEIKKSSLPGDDLYKTIVKQHQARTKTGVSQVKQHVRRGEKKPEPPKKGIVGRAVEGVKAAGKAVKEAVVGTGGGKPQAPAAPQMPGKVVGRTASGKSITAMAPRGANLPYFRGWKVKDFENAQKILSKRSQEALAKGDIFASLTYERARMAHVFAGLMKRAEDMGVSVQDAQEIAAQMVEIEGQTNGEQQPEMVGQEGGMPGQEGAPMNPEAQAQAQANGGQGEFAQPEAGAGYPAKPDEDKPVISQMKSIEEDLRMSGMNDLLKALDGDALGKAMVRGHQRRTRTKTAQVKTHHRRDFPGYGGKGKGTYLMTQDLLAKIPPLYSSEGTPLNEKTIYAKFFTPDGNATWYVAEYDPQERLIFGWATLGDDEMAEWGYSSLDELESAKGPMGLHVERDKFFKPRPFKDVIAEHDQRHGSVRSVDGPPVGAVAAPTEGSLRAILDSYGLSGHYIEGNVLYFFDKESHAKGIRYLAQNGIKLTPVDLGEAEAGWAGQYYVQKALKGGRICLGHAGPVLAHARTIIPEA